MGVRKRWTAKELDTVDKFYGIWEKEKLLKSVHATEEQFAWVVRRHKLGFQKDRDEYVTMHQVEKIMDITYAATQKFIKNGLPVIRKTFSEKTYVMVKHEDLINWLEQHQDLWLASKVEYMALGQEPEWLMEKRKKDLNNQKRNKTMINPKSKPHEIIQRQRWNQNLSMRTVAEKTGFSQATICYYENGKVKKMRYDIIEKLAEVLECTPEYLMGWEG